MTDTPTSERPGGTPGQTHVLDEGVDVVPEGAPVSDPRKAHVVIREADFLVIPQLLQHGPEKGICHDGRLDLEEVDGAASRKSKHW